jgi:hypothetical protein
MMPVYPDCSVLAISLDPPKGLWRGFVWGRREPALPNQADFASIRQMETSLACFPRHGACWRTPVTGLDRQKAFAPQAVRRNMNRGFLTTGLHANHLPKLRHRL